MTTELWTNEPILMPHETAREPSRADRWPADRTARLREDAPVVTHLDPPSYASEQYRALALQVEEKMANDSTLGYVLAVTSGEEGSGKTLTSLNLALTLARGGERRVLLVESDLWRPRLSTYFAPPLPADRGLLAVLEQRLTVDAALLQVDGISVDLLPAGCEGKPGDLLSGRRLLGLLNELRSRYEVVIVDTPPLPLLASARAVATRADGVLVVVRTGRSRRHDIEAVLGSMGPEKIIGVVLNGTRVQHRGYY